MDVAGRWGIEDVRIAGPTFFFADGSSMGTGRWAAPIAGSGWAIVTGNITFGELDDMGFALVESCRGHATDLCGLLD